MKHLGLERKEGVIKVMVVEVRLSLVEGGISRSGGVEHGEREEKKNPIALAFWMPRWFGVQIFSLPFSLSCLRLR